MGEIGDSFTSFRGILVRRHYRPGQKYIQLVFETTAGVRLTLTRNIRMVEKLVLGQRYEVRGQEYRIGHKTYVHDPQIVPVQLVQTIVPRRKQRILALTGSVLLICATMSGTAAMWHHAGSQEQAYSRNIDTADKQDAETSAIAHKARKPAGYTRSPVTPSVVAAPQPVTMPSQPVSATTVFDRQIVVDSEPPVDPPPAPVPAPMPLPQLVEVAPVAEPPTDVPTVSVTPEIPADSTPTFSPPQPTPAPAVGEPIPVTPTVIVTY